MEAFLKDLRYGLRMFLKNPGFSAVAVLTLALGIGANTAIFSVVNTVLLRSLPYPDPDRLVVLWDDMKGQKSMLSPGNFLSWREQSQVFEDMAAYQWRGLTLTGVDEPARLVGMATSASLFPLLGAQAALGRLFGTDDDRPGAQKVAVISHAFWQRRFGGQLDVLGKTLVLNGESYAVIGVMAPSFQFLAWWNDVWVPLALGPGEAGNHGAHQLGAIARLKAGVTERQAAAEMDTIARALEKEFPKTNTGARVMIVPLREELAGGVRRSLLILQVAVGLVLLIACANIANLLLARSTLRRKEMGIRAALGASRFRLIRQSLTEGVILSLGASAVGLLLTHWGLKLLVRLVPQSLQRSDQIEIDTTVLFFAMLLSLVTVAIFGLMPAITASKVDLNETLKEASRSSSGGRQGNRLRRVLVITEVALALVLLTGAGLLIKSFVRLRGVNSGFNEANLLTMRLTLPISRYRTLEQRAGFYDQVIPRIKALPGVKSAAFITQLPVALTGGTNVYAVEGQPPPPGHEPVAHVRIVTPEYFRTMEIPLRQGRYFDEQDHANSPPVAIVSETLARLHWPNESPIGKRLKLNWYDSPWPWVQIVGVSSDVRQDGLDQATSTDIYFHYQQNPTEWLAPRELVIRTTTEPQSLIAAVRREIRAVDKDEAVYRIRTMEEILSQSLAERRFRMMLLGVFSAVALVLAAVGIGGVISYLVSQRGHEIGIRMALGAERRDILRLIVREGLFMTVIGVAIGLAGALALTRLMKTLLFGISARDPLTFAGVSLLLVAVALLASYIPARRATRVDPMVALRYE